MSKAANSIILSSVLLLVCAIFAEASGQIVFLEYVAPLRCHIYTMNPDGTNVERLTEEPDHYNSPRWSPDGSKIAYVVYVDADGKNNEVWVMNADGTSPELIYKGSVFGGASWSPDGERITFAANGQVTILDLRTQKDFPQIAGLAPIWSTDGRAIAYQTTGLDTGELLLLFDPETNRKWDINLVKEGVGIVLGHWSSIDWSPDGEKIAFRGWDPATNFAGIYTMASDGTDITEVYSGKGSALWPSWSPDGKQIIFDGPRGIEVIDVDGETPELIYEGGWQPDWGRSSVAVESPGKAATTWGYVKSE